jgi:anti-sigma B factor antagonist
MRLGLACFSRRSGGPRPWAPWGRAEGAARGAKSRDGMAQDLLSIDVQSTPDGETRVFVLHGSLDISTSPTVRAALVEAADRGQHEIIVDLTHLEFLDSTGLGALIGAHKRARDHEGRVRLVVHEGQILRLLRITGLLSVFPVYMSIDAALADEAPLVGL